MAPPEVFMKETWRLELSVSVYGELDAVDPHSPVRSGEFSVWYGRGMRAA